MIRQILLGIKGSEAETLVIADESKSISDITSIVKRAATAGEYRGFDRLEKWDRASGVSKTLPLNRRAQKAEAKKAAPKKAKK